MRQTTMTTIETVLLADPTVGKDAIDRIKAACSGAVPRPGPKVTAQRAAEVLGVHVKTLGRYARAGRLHAIRLSRRKIRYSLAEVEQFAATGMADTTRPAAPGVGAAESAPFPVFPGLDANHSSSEL